MIARMSRPPARRTAMLCVALGLVFLTPALVRAASKPLPAAFQILLQRSIFSRLPIVPGRPPAPAATVPEFSAAARASDPIFIGTVFDEHECVAFLEDTAATRTIGVRVGQLFPQGRVVAVTLNYLMVQPFSNDPARRVELGQTLSGEVPSAAAVATTAPGETVPTTSTASAAPPPGAPAGAPPAPAPAGGSANDLLERLRQRRLKELQLK